MRFGVIEKDHIAKVCEHDIPKCGDDQVVIRNKVCNICTSDYQQWLGLRQNRKMPSAFGHENAGIVDRVGKNVKNVKVGDQVVTNVYSPCMQCKSCREGKNSFRCENPELHPADTDSFGYYGTYGCSEYKVVDSKQVYRVVGDISFEEMAFCEPLSTVIHGIKRLHVKAGEQILVIGAGTMGMLNAMVAKAYGAEVIISDVSELKLKNAKKMGYHNLINPLKDNYKEKVEEYTDGKGVDSIIIAVGASSAYEQALEIARLESKLLIFAAGYPEPEWSLKPNAVHYKLLQIIGTYGCTPADFEQAAEFLGKRIVNVNGLIQSRYKLDDIQEAFSAASTKDAYRVSVLM